MIAVVDGLKGFPEAIAASYPKTIVQTCIVHLIRASLAFVSWKDRKAIMPDMREIYRAETAEAAVERLDAFETKWARRYPTIAATPAFAGAGSGGGLGAGGSAVRLSAGHPAHDLHHERGGEPVPEPTQDHQNARQFPE